MARHAPSQGERLPTGRSRWALLLLALVPMGAGAQAPTPTPAPVPVSTPVAGAPANPSPVVRLEVRGFTFTGFKADEVYWSGTGAWIRGGAVATNAYFLERATSVKAVDEQGHSYELDTLIAWDPANDLAILQTQPSETKHPSVVLTPQPDRPDALQGAGLTALIAQNGKLVSYSGHARQVLSQVHGKTSVLRHDTQVPAAKGGLEQRYVLVSDKDPRQLVGFNYSSAPSGSSAVPAWTVRKVDAWALEVHRPWVKLDKAFERQSIEALERAPLYQQEAEGYMRMETDETSIVKRCLQPGKNVTVTLPIQESRDLVIRVKTEPANSRFLFGLFAKGPTPPGQTEASQEKECCDQRSAKGSLGLIYTIPQSGTHYLMVGTPTFAKREVCFEIIREFVNWTRGLP